MPTKKGFPNETTKSYLLLAGEQKATELKVQMAVVVKAGLRSHFGWWVNSPPSLEPTLVGIGANPRSVAGCGVCVCVCVSIIRGFSLSSLNNTQKGFPQKKVYTQVVAKFKSFCQLVVGVAQK